MQPACPSGMLLPANSCMPPACPYLPASATYHLPVSAYATCCPRHMSLACPCCMLAYLGHNYATYLPLPHATCLHLPHITCLILPCAHASCLPSLDVTCRPLLHARLSQPYATCLSQLYGICPLAPDIHPYTIPCQNLSNFPPAFSWPLDITCKSHSIIQATCQ